MESNGNLAPSEGNLADEQRFRGTVIYSSTPFILSHSSSTSVNRNKRLWFERLPDVVIEVMPVMSLGHRKRQVSGYGTCTQ